MKDLEVNQFDFFIHGLDWISVINDGMSYNDMLVLLDSNGIGFHERYYMDKKYVVIEKTTDNYRNFLLLFCAFKDIRITRFDFKLDYKNEFKQVIERFQFDSHSEVSKNGEVETIYFNSRQSDMFCRLYNKQIESNLPFPLTRLEYEIKGNLAYEFSKRLLYIGFSDALNFIFDKINAFNERKGLTEMFYMTTHDFIPVEFIEQYSVKNKFRRFVKHNKNSYAYYIDYFNMNPDEFDKVMTGVIDLEKFLEVH